MPDGFSSVILYHSGDRDISQALLRCRDLVALVCQGLYPGADSTGYEPDPELTSTDPPASLLWWLSSLQVTLDSLYCHALAYPAGPLATALQAYLSQHPEQTPRLRQVLLEANARDFIQWDQVSTFISSPKPLSESAPHRSEAMPPLSALFGRGGAG